MRVCVYFLILAVVTVPFNPVWASASGALFDIEARKARLQTEPYARIRSYCMAENLPAPAESIPAAFPALKITDEYGTDNALEDFSYFLMIHSGRALAGEKNSAVLVKKALLDWARADALEQTPTHFDTFYALKRGLLPIITSYEIVRPDLSRPEREIIEGWIDPLVTRIDAHFDKEVDRNNHRYLADSVLTVWGDVSGNPALYAKGKKRFLTALSQMEEDGGLPLETRRGARALWYMRQSLASLSLIATVYQRNGDTLYSLRKNHASLPLMMHYFLSGVHYPFTVLASASQNHIPGPSQNFLRPEMGMLTRRGHGRHYMAFASMYLANTPKSDPAHQRLAALMRESVLEERPLIDEFVGGNATCFWEEP